MTIFDDVTSEAVKWSIGAVGGWAIIQTPVIKKWLSAHPIAQITVVSGLTAVVIGSCLVYAYDRYRREPLSINFGDAADGIKADALGTPGNKGPVVSTCSVGDVAVGFAWEGNPNGDCTGCVARGHLICRKITIGKHEMSKSN